MTVKKLMDLIRKLYIQYQSAHKGYNIIKLIGIDSDEVTRLLNFRKKLKEHRNLSENINNIDPKLFKEFLETVAIGLLSAEEATQTLFIQLQNKLAENDNQIKAKIKNIFPMSEQAHSLLENHGLTKQFPNVLEEANQENKPLSMCIIRLAWHRHLLIFKNTKFNPQEIKDFAKFYMDLYDKNLILSKEILEELSAKKCPFGMFLNTIRKFDFKLTIPCLLDKELVKAFNILIYNFDDDHQNQVLSKFGIKLLAECKANRIDIAVILRLLSCMVLLDDKNLVTNIEELVNKVKNSPEKIASLKKLIVLLFNSMAKTDRMWDEPPCFQEYKIECKEFLYSLCNRYEIAKMPAEILKAIATNIGHIDDLHLSLKKLTETPSSILSSMWNYRLSNPDTREFLAITFIPWMLNNPHQIKNINETYIKANNDFLASKMDDYYWRKILLFGLNLIYASLSSDHSSLFINYTSSSNSDINQDIRNYTVAFLKAIDHPFSYCLQYRIYSGKLWRESGFSISPEELKELRNKIPVNSLWDKWLFEQERSEKIIQKQQEQQKNLFSFTQNGKLADTLIFFGNNSTTTITTTGESKCTPVPDPSDKDENEETGERKYTIVSNPSHEIG